MAYEFLTNGKPYLPFYKAEQNNSFYANENETKAYEEWKRKAKEKAEQQAQWRLKEFKRKNEAFKKTALYPITVLVTLWIILLTAAFTVFFFSLPLVALYLGWSWWAFLICCVFALPGFYSYKSLKELWKGLIDIMN